MGHSYAWLVYIDVVKWVRRHVEISLHRHSNAAPYERARALVGRAREKC
jgi:hypothetical protein